MNANSFYLNITRYKGKGYSNGCRIKLYQPLFESYDSLVARLMKTC